MLTVTACGEHEAAGPDDDAELAAGEGSAGSAGNDNAEIDDARATWVGEGDPNAHLGTLKSAIVTLPGDADLIGQWRFDEGSGTTANDSSGQASHGSITTALWDSDGRSGSCLRFDGASSKVTVPDGAWNFAGSRTVAVWFKSEGSPQGMVLEHQRSSAISGSWSLGPLNLAGYSPQNFTLNYPPAPPGTWTMAVAVVTPSELRLYKDGVRVATSALAAAFPVTPGPLSIGARGSASDNFFRGSIDDVSIYKRAFSDAEVLTLYQRYPSVPAPGNGGLVARWTFDDGAGSSVLNDSSGQGIHGQISNATWAPNCRIGGCLYFNGTSSNVSVPDGTWNNGTPATYVGWFKTDGTPVGMVLEHQLSSAVPGAFSVRATSVGGYDGAVNNVVFPYTVPANTWTMFTFVVSSNQLRVFKDGVLTNTAALNGGMPYRPGPLSFGMRSFVQDNFFKGWIDETSVYNRALSDAEVSALYQSYQSGQSLAADLIAYLSFDEGAGTMAADWSGHGNTGQLVNATWAPATQLRGGSLYFNGTNAALELPSGGWNGQPATYVFWYRPDGAMADTYLMEHGHTGAAAGAFALRNNQISYYAANGEHSMPLDFAAAPSGEWAMAAAVIGPSQIRAYSNWASKTGGANIVGETTTQFSGMPKLPGALYFGARGEIPDHFFKGWIDEVAIYKRALNDSELQAIFQAYQAGGPGIQTGSTTPTVGLVNPNKHLYRKGESGTATVAVTNFSPTMQTFTLSLDARRWLRTDRMLYSQPRTLAPGQTASYSIPFTFSPGEEQFGVELRATAAIASSVSTATEFVAVSNSTWEVGVSGAIDSKDFWWAGQARISRQLRDLVRSYTNWVEYAFWAPDDFAEMTPSVPSWGSGQTHSFENDALLRSAIVEGHQYGIKTVTYGKNVGSGPEGWEFARKRPELFGNHPPVGFYGVEDFDQWSQNPGAPKQNYFLVPDHRMQSTLDYGIAEINGSVAQYGWDGIRYDGHYSAGNSELLLYNMQATKAGLQTNRTDFMLGFNFMRGPDTLFAGPQNRELREAMVGNGMYLQEAIRHWEYLPGTTYTTWSLYAANEIKAAKTVGQLGGHYYCSWSLNDGFNPPNVSLYKLIYGLIAGGHSMYGHHQAELLGCDNWGKFMTRWSAFLWSQRLRSITNVASQVSVSPSPLIWQPLAQELVASPTRKFKVVHLVNPPPSGDAITGTTLPTSAVQNVAVTLTSEAGTSVVSAVLVRPEAEPYDTVLTTVPLGSAVQVVVPQIKYWGMVIFELQGSFTEPPVATYSDTPVPALVAANRTPTALAQFPDEAPVQNPVALAPGDSLEQTDADGSSVNAYPVLDPVASNGVAQRYDLSHPGATFGRTWIKLSTGRYRVRVRMKVSTDPNSAADQEVSVVQQLNGAQVNFQRYRTNPQGTGDIQLIADNNYHDYYNQPYTSGTTFFDVTETSNFHLIAAASITPTPPNPNNQSSIQMDAFVIEKVADLTDDQIAPLLPPVVKPGGLRVPTGRSPAKVLLVKGIYHALYNVPAAVPAALLSESYALPATYGDLYQYDAIVLVNFDFGFNIGFAQRKMLHDFVADGGRLVLLGGPEALGPGHVQRSYQDSDSPFTIQALAETSVSPALVLAEQVGVPYAGNPALFYRHDDPIKTNADVSVDAYAGTLPIAARMRVGNGLVTAFLGSVSGQPPSGTTPFWQTASWTLLAQKLVLGDPPRVSLVPSGSNYLLANTSTALAATASGAGGPLTVKFYCGSTQVGSTLTASPYNTTWTPPGEGACSLNATASTVLGLSSAANAVPLRVLGSLDVGPPGGGSASIAGTGIFTVNGKGAGIGGTADAFRFVSGAVTGNYTITARVSAFNSAAANARAGITFRESTAANAREVSLLLGPTGGQRTLYFVRRSSTGGVTTTTATAPAALNPWLRIARAGDTFTAQQSPDGVNWVLIGSVDVTMPSERVGLAVTNGSALAGTAAAQATFDNVAIP